MKHRKTKLDPFAPRLREWFGIEKVTLKEAQDRLAQDGCSVSATSLSQWWQREQQQLLREQICDRIKTGATLNQEITAAYKKDPAPELSTLISMIRTMVMQLSAASETDTQSLKLIPTFLREVLSARKLDLQEKDSARDDRRLVLLEKKAAQAEGARKVVESALTPEQKQLQLRQIFGMSS